MKRSAFDSLRRRASLLPFAAALLFAAGRASAQAEAPDSLVTPEAETAPALAPVEAPPEVTPEPMVVRAPVDPNPRQTVSRKVRLDASDHNVVRSGPGDRFAIAGVFKKGATFTVIAKSGDWYNVRLSDTETGWIHSSLCKEFDDLSDLEFKPNAKLYSRTGSFIVSGYGGAYAFDRKSNSLVLGGRLGYYVLDRLQAEGGLAWTHVRRPAEIVESLFGLTLEAEDFHMLFYNMNLTFELLPGRQMVPFVTGGVGSSIMQGRTETSYNFGAGTMLYVSKRLATRWEVRDFRFTSGSDDSRVSNNNIEFTLATNFLF
jgi:outer membrane beta-barrel protein